MQQQSGQSLENKRVFISTYGCQMNVNDSERMYSLLEMANCSTVTSPDQADIIIINACSVREKPVHKVYSEIGKYRKFKNKNPNLRIGVGGCVGQQEKGNLLTESPLIDFVFGTDNIDLLPSIIAKSYEIDPKTEKHLRPVEAQFEHRAPYHVETLVIFTNVAKGCDNFCTTVIVTGKQI